MGEALSLGTPLVALAHGGPAQSAALWTESPAALVSPAGVEATSARLARAIDRVPRELPPRSRRSRFVRPLRWTTMVAAGV